MMATGSIMIRPGSVLARYQATPPNNMASVRPIGHRIEVGAAHRTGVGGPGHGAVEGVGDAGEQQEQEPDRQVAGTDGDGGDTGHQDADDGDDIGGDAGLDEAAADGEKTAVDLGAQVAVEHEEPSWGLTGSG